jgi:antitoxin YefM
VLGVAQYQAMQEKIEMLEDIQTSISQLAEGKGLDHEVAGSMVRDSLKD